MSFLKRLFGRKEQPAARPSMSESPEQTQAQQDATRERMEAEVASDRERRGATDVRPGN